MIKKAAILLLLSVFCSVKAQITLEHDYSGASTYGNSNQLMLINFEVLGEHYVNINRGAKTVSIYNLNHSLTRNISLAALPIGNNSGSIDDILYISQNLFNLDTLIEFMYIKDGCCNTQSQLWVYDETGTILFSDSAGVPIRTNIPVQQYPIYNTSQGTKMILSYKNGHAKVWGLVGTLSTAIQQANQNLMQAQGMLSNPAPNPAVTSTKIDYRLPKEANQGEIVFYDQQGTEVKRFKVDKTFDHLLLSTSDLPAGAYYYQLQAEGKATEGKKMVVIR